ncbi:MAG TPA: hypothetical protein VEK76_09970 [Candidatus Binatia bacterium]|nr:hypothetical protein [Candidatus Binatia bacterium]
MSGSAVEGAARLRLPRRADQVRPPRVLASAGGWLRIEPGSASGTGLLVWMPGAPARTFEGTAA